MITIEFSGGIDISTGKENKLKLSNIIPKPEPTDKIINVTPLSTIKEKLVIKQASENNGIVTTENITTSNQQISNIFVINPGDDNIDFITENNENVTL